MPDPRAQRTLEPHGTLAWRVTLAVRGITDARAGSERAAGEGVGEAQEAARPSPVRGEGERQASRVRRFWLANEIP